MQQPRFSMFAPRRAVWLALLATLSAAGPAPSPTSSHSPVDVVTTELFGLVSTFAGGGSAGGDASGYSDGMGTAALFHWAIGVAADSSGQLYVSDEYNNLIRLVSTAGLVSTFAGGGAGGTDSGNADGVGSSATFFRPQGIALGGGNLFVADASNNIIRKVVVGSALVTTLAGGGSVGGTTFGFADGVGTIAQFIQPFGLAIDPAALYLFVADFDNHLIRRIVISSGSVTTLAGGGSSGGSSSGFADGTGTAAMFTNPAGVAVDAAGLHLYVMDSGNNLIRQIIIGSGAVTVVAGGGSSGGVASGSVDGVGTLARFNSPYGVAVNTSGTTLIVSDTSNNLVRFVAIATGAVTTLAGGGSTGGIATGHADGLGTAATFNNPVGVTVNAAGVIFVAEMMNHLVRQIEVIASVVPSSTATSSGTATSTSTSSGTSTATSSRTGTGTSTSSSTPSAATGTSTATSSGTGTSTSTSSRTSSSSSTSSSTGTSTSTSSRTGTSTSTSSGTGSSTSTSSRTGTSTSTNSGTGTSTSSSTSSSTASATQSPAGPPFFTAYTPTTVAVAGSAYVGYTFAATSVPAIPITFGFAGSLPPGLTLAPDTGVLSGTPPFPSAAGAYPFNVTATNAVGTTVVASTIVVVLPNLTAVTPAYPGAFDGVPYAGSDITISTSYGIAPVTFSVSAGALPAGLTLNTSTGALTGTPTQLGTFNFTVSAVDSRLAPASVAVIDASVTVGASQPIFTADTPPAAATALVPYAYAYATVSFPASSPTYSVASGVLPPGLAIDPATGALTGTPNATGNYTFAVCATNEAGTTTAHPSTISVGPSPPLFTAYSPPDSAVAGSAYAGYTYAATSFPESTITYSVVGILPIGLSLDPSSGILDGIPAAEGTYVFNVTATNSFGTVAVMNTITVLAAPAPSVPAATSAPSPAPVTSQIQLNVLLVGGSSTSLRGGSATLLRAALLSLLGVNATAGSTATITSLVDTQAVVSTAVLRGLGNNVSAPLTTNMTGPSVTTVVASNDPVLNAPLPPAGSRRRRLSSDCTPVALSQVVSSTVTTATVSVALALSLSMSYFSSIGALTGAQQYNATLALEAAMTAILAGNSSMSATSQALLSDFAGAWAACTGMPPVLGVISSVRAAVAAPSASPSPSLTIASSATALTPPQVAAIVAGVVAAVLLCCILFFLFLLVRGWRKRPVTDAEVAYAARIVSAQVTHLDGSAVVIAPLGGGSPPALRVHWESVGYSASAPVSIALVNRLIAKGPIVLTQIGHYRISDSGAAIITLPASIGTLVTADNSSSFSVVVSASGHTEGPRAAETAKFIIPPLSAGPAPIVRQTGEHWDAYREVVAVAGIAPVATIV